MIQRNFWRNVLPSVIAFAFSGVYSIVDGMFVGQGVGDAGLAAINVAWPVTALVQALGTGLGMAAAVVLSVCIGRRDAAEEHRALGSTAVLLLLAGVLTLVTAGMTLYSMCEYVWQNRAVLGGAK